MKYLLAIALLLAAAPATATAADLEQHCSEQAAVGGYQFLRFIEHNPIAPPADRDTFAAPKTVAECEGRLAAHFRHYAASDPARKHLDNKVIAWASLPADQRSAVMPPAWAREAARRAESAR